VAELWLLIALGTAVTYMWRGLGVLLSGHMRTDSDFFNWVACVAYAMVAGLVMRLVVMPSGVVAATLLSHRLLACALALAAYYGSRRNLFVAVITGAAALIALNYLRAL
jgi:branched-subunit amino acid transport protein